MIRHLRFLKFKFASTLIGAFLCLLTATCNEKKSTAEWESSTSEPNKPSAVAADATASQESKTTTSEKSVTTKETRFVVYNLENYLTMRRYTDGKAAYTSKPEEEIVALLDVIQGSRPDILGVCEIGSEADLKDFQTRLKKVGVDLPHTHRVQGTDKVRSLALLSRYPIVATTVPKNLSYTLNKIEFKISRGILDATVQLPNRKVRFLGVHFKSKRPIKEADQEMMRRNESILLRQHIDDILVDSPDEQILAYGDFNDTKRTKSVYSVRGRSNSQKRMEMIEVADSRGENWTHNWTREDIYSRFDFAMTNLNLAPHINKDGSRILDPKSWQKASDHRALLVLIK